VSVPDEGGFSDFYLRCRDRLARQVFGLTADRTEAVEVVQEAFVRAWQRWDSVSSLEDPEGWVRRVAYRLAVSRWRRTRRLVFGQRDAGAARAPDDPVVARVDLVAALQLLPVRQRQAVVLRHLGGLSVKEVAADLGVPVGTAKTWLSRGRERLSQLLADGDSLEAERS
jgi:RNA polymerase sigma-70 factor (ECF subfamily)